MPRHKASVTPAQAEIQAEPLCDSVVALTQHVRVLIDVLDDIREDLNWITRNGIPHGRPIEHTRLVRMARDPLAPDAREHLELRTYTLEPHGPSALTPEIFDALVSDIAEAMTVVGQEQLNMFLSALDDVRAKLLVAIKNPTGKPTTEEAVIPPETDLSMHVPTASSSITEPGRLF